MRRKEKEKIEERLLNLASNIEFEENKGFDKTTDSKAEGMDYEHDASDDEGVEVSVDLEGKNVVITQQNVTHIFINIFTRNNSVNRKKRNF